MGSADVHLRTGRPGRALHREACPPRWGARCPPHAVQGRGGTQGQTADLTVTPVQTPARSAAAAWTGERPASPSPRVRRSATAQGPAGRASAVLRGARNASGCRPRPPGVRSREAARRRRDPGLREPGFRLPGGRACCPRARGACKRSEIPHVLQEGRCLTFPKKGDASCSPKKADASRSSKKGDASPPKKGNGSTSSKK